MGEARRRQLLEAVSAGQKTKMEEAVQRVATAMRKLSTAASSQLGFDCYMHAEMGRRLLADLGFTFETRVGAACWRVGPGSGDVLSHLPGEKSFGPANAMSFPYHAWLECGEWIADLTTYQFHHKASLLDAADGGTTQVDWCPDHLLLRKTEIQSQRKVAQAFRSGGSYYHAIPELEQVLRSRAEQLSAEDLYHARLILGNPDMQVIGPNSLAP